MAGAALAAITYPAADRAGRRPAPICSIPAQEAELTRKLEALQRASSRQLVVATVSNLQDRPIEDYGVGLGRALADRPERRE